MNSDSALVKYSATLIHLASSVHRHRHHRHPHLKNPSPPPHQHTSPLDHPHQQQHLRAPLQGKRYL